VRPDSKKFYPPEIAKEAAELNYEPVGGGLPLIRRRPTWAAWVLLAFAISILVWAIPYVIAFYFLFHKGLNQD
jgi:hypothetical protein